MFYEQVIQPNYNVSSIEQFNSAYGFEQEPFTDEQESVKKSSVSESGTSDGFEQNLAQGQDLGPQEGDTTFAGAFGADTEQLTEDFTPETETQAQDISTGMMAMSTPKEGDVLKSIEKDARIRQETEQIQEQERLDLEFEQERIDEKKQQISQSDSFMEEVESIDLQSENPIYDLNEKYNKYGINFYDKRKEGMIARARNGKQIKINKDDEQALKDFIAANFELPQEVKDEDFLTKAFNVKKSRRKAMKNEDGSVSTVRMSSADNFAFPTIFPKRP